VLASISATERVPVSPFPPLPPQEGKTINADKTTPK